MISEIDATEQEYKQTPCAGYTPAQIANYFIALANKQKKHLTPMQLIKLTYIAYTWYYAWTDKKLFDEKIEAWQHGPVIPSLYHEFKRFGKNSITEYAKDLDEEGNLTLAEIGDSEEDMNLLGMIADLYEHYGNYSASKLRNLTHELKSPWHNVYSSERNNYIRLGDMKERATQKLIQIRGIDTNECA